MSDEVSFGSGEPLHIELENTDVSQANPTSSQHYHSLTMDLRLLSMSYGMLCDCDMDGRSHGYLTNAPVVRDLTSRMHCHAKMEDSS